MVEARGGVVCIFRIDDVGLSGMAQRSLADERALMDSRRAASSVWRHGGVDGSSGEGLYFGLSSWRWIDKRWDKVTSGECAQSAISGLWIMPGS
jgi:hypothetical protein